MSVAPACAKSADRMDGAMTGVCFMARMVPRSAARRRSETPERLELVVGRVDLARALLGLLALGGGRVRRLLVRVVLRDQAAVGVADLLVAGFGRESQDLIGIAAAAPALARDDRAEVGLGGVERARDALEHLLGLARQGAVGRRDV